MNQYFVARANEGQYAEDVKSEIFGDSEYNPVRLIKDAVSTVNPDEIEKSEITKKKLFLDGLGVVAARNGIEIMPELLMNQQAGQKAENISFAGSQDIMLRADFENVVSRISEGEYLYIAGTQTPSKYHFSFGFMGDNPQAHPLGSDTRFTQPVLMVDDKALKAMEDAGVSQEKIQQYFQGFMKMAEMAEHDYLHATIMPNIINGEEVRSFHQKTFSRINALEQHAQRQPRP